jgi:hypothetical protein
MMVPHACVTCDGADCWRQACGCRVFDAHPEQLFDVLNDPTESTNLATVPAWSDVLSTLAGDIKAWQLVTADPWYLKYTHE